MARIKYRKGGSTEGGEKQKLIEPRSHNVTETGVRFLEFCNLPNTDFLKLIP